MEKLIVGLIRLGKALDFTTLKNYANTSRNKLMNKPILVAAISFVAIWTMTAGIAYGVTVFNKSLNVSVNVVEEGVDFSFYYDRAATQAATQVSLPDVEPGDVSTFTVYVKNTSAVTETISAGSNTVPSSVGVLTLTFDGQTQKTLAPGAVSKIVGTLNVSSNATPGPINFTFSVNAVPVAGTSASTPTPTSTPPPTPTSVAWQPDGIISSGEYQQDTSLSSAFHLYWNSDGQYIYVGMRASTSGWVAIGLPGSQMKNVDLILGYVSSGQTTIYDLFSSGSHQAHQPDTAVGGTNDLIEYGGSEQGGYTTIEFKRALNTGDTYDLPFNQGLNSIIWAYGVADDPGSSHIERGYGQLTIN